MPFNNLNIGFYSPTELSAAVAERARELRLARGERQEDLAAAAGVTLSTLRRFERNGKVGFEIVAKIALALGAEREFLSLFSPRDTRTLDDILNANRPRQRARKKT